LENNIKAVIVYSSGLDEAGEILEKTIVDLITKYNVCLIGLNCTDVVNENYKGVSRHKFLHIILKGRINFKFWNPAVL
jgi:acyl-CoA synthetase (NDP forming)